MTSLSRLGGFKVLKDVVRFSLVMPADDGDLAGRFCRTVADNKINLPYITLARISSQWGLNLTVEAPDNDRILPLIKETVGNEIIYNTKSAILSIFPHKNNPEVPGILYEVFGKEEIEPDALANSPSAISIIIKEELLNKVSSALFGPFSFSAYRTPSDWKLAQKGKEQLYKEVVASYQEKRPKVYGLGYQEEQELLHLRFKGRDMGHFGAALKEFARMGLGLSFLISSPCGEEDEVNILFCLPEPENSSHTEIINRIIRNTVIENITSAAVFSMNGPHFGDRYGIISELLNAFEGNGVQLLGLSCTIASITGAVPSSQVEPALKAIQGCFEVPSVIKKR